MKTPSFTDRHATGLTMTLFVLVIVALSALPGPEWIQTLDFVRHEHPVDALFAKIFAKPESVPRPSQGYVAGGGGTGIAEEDRFVRDESEQDELEEIAPTRTRTPWQRPSRERFERHASALGLEAAEMVIPCLQPKGASGASCKRFALDRFFQRLAAAEDAEGAEGRGIARIVHYGDSLIASDKITDMVRNRLQERFGSAGRGFLLIKKFNTFQRGNRMGKGTGGWVLDVITQGVLRDEYFGYTGASFTAQKAGEKSVFESIGANRKVEVYYLEERTGGELEVLADGKVVDTFSTQTTSATKEARVRALELPEGTKSMELRAKSPGSRVFGVVLEAGVPGVIYESVGLPGATSEVWTIPDADDFQRQLGRRDPALVVVMLGGNDGLMLSKRRTSIEKIETKTREFVKRAQVAAPSADCMLVSPLESVRAKADGSMTPKPEVLEVIAVQKLLAAELGCAFWDMHASMGGEGSLKKWVNANLMLGDLIHPKSRGSDLLGEMMAESIMEAYDARMVSDAGGVN